MELLPRLFGVSLLTLLVLEHAHADFHAPCYGCRLFNIVHKEHPENIKQKSALCNYPCQCPVQELKCNEGVNIVKDGCSCCYMCARQRGDMCSDKDKCDDHKGLYCDNKRNSTGTCQAWIKKPCIADGVSYKDGQRFKPDCKRLCTCQNGFYGCVSECPQEAKRPSDVTCRNPTLLSVPGKCCKEWTCERRENMELRDSVSGLESQNLVIHPSLWQPQATITAAPTIEKPRCHLTSTDWTPCSVTCGVGVSVRVIAHTNPCKAVQERQLCYLRPCDRETRTWGRQKCTPTTRSGRRVRIKYQDCHSIKEYNMKFCTNCKKNLCCYPKKTRTRFVEFECSGGHREYMNFMWIKRCRCDRQCYVPDKRKRHLWSRHH